MKNILLALVVVALFACEKTDSLKPGIALVKINGFENYAFINREDNFNYYYSVSDNEALNRLTVTAEKGFVFEENIVRTVSDFSYFNNVSLSGTQDEGTIVVPVGDAVASGKYHMVFEVSDKEGNVGILKKFNFIYQDNAEGSRPFWSAFASTPSYTNGAVTLNRGNEIIIDANVKSQNDIKSIRVEFVGQDGTEMLIEKTLDGDQDFEFNFEDFTAENGQPIPIIIPSTTTPGLHPLLVTAIDANNNAGIIQVNVVVPF